MRYKITDIFFQLLFYFGFWWRFFKTRNLQSSLILKDWIHLLISHLVAPFREWHYTSFIASVDVRASLRAAGGRMKKGNKKALNKKYSISILMTPLNETEDARIKSTYDLQGTELCLHRVFYQSYVVSIIRLFFFRGLNFSGVVGGRGFSQSSRKKANKEENSLGNRYKKCSCKRRYRFSDMVCR